MAVEQSGVLAVDPTRCDGVGMCALMAPGLITLDPWGFPILPDRIVDPGDAGAAAKAVTSCPRRALFWERVAPVSPPREPHVDAGGPPEL